MNFTGDYPPEMIATVPSSCVSYIDLAAVTPIVDISPARRPIGLGVLPFLELHTNHLALNTNISNRIPIQNAS
ncbi:hypothetical protein IG631_11135 [Alternaria alternata]|nr:hypothetical protein IG631_11135 [Alternaria alternata]